MHEIGIVLPAVAPPVANYIPFVRTGKLVFISGQITLENGVPQFLGKLGREYTIEDGQRAARVCALNVVAQLKAACGGNLDKVKRCVRIGGFVNSMADFVDQPKVMNGASDLLVEVFGDDGKHARTAVGVNTLPWGVAVEVEALFELR
ncbi:MAG: RidA family protein [Rhodospirillaceae bacterium]|nr:RidA family protein [Rhodospirillaceae bacterium]